jgi:pilus assembly protein CpaB
MRRSYISLAAGIVLALVAIVVMRLYIGAATGGTRDSEGDFTRIAVVARDLPAGSVLEPAEVSLVRWPAESVPSGAFTDIDSIFKGAKASNDRVALTSLVRGEPLLRSKVSGLGARPIMSSMVGDGMRAFSVKIDDVSGVAGFILPGDHVDIMLTRTIGSNSSNLVTDVILQGIKVLGIDQLASTEADKPVVGRTATVEVTPEQAGMLALAQQAGKLSLALRNSATASTADVSRIGVSDLISGHRQPVRRSVRRVSADGIQVQYGVSDSPTRAAAAR